MGTAKFLDNFAFGPLVLEGLWLRYAMLQNVMHALQPVAIQGKIGITLCHLATLRVQTQGGKKEKVRALQ